VTPGPRSPRLARALLALAVAVLALGLPRHLVRCEHADGEAHLEFVHAEGAHETAPAPSLPADDGDAACEAGCEHTVFVVAPGTQPDHAAAAKAAALSCLGLVPHELPPLHERVAFAWLPPPTGPPRPDERTALRRTIELLL
jgi:hypothetical protein